MKIYKHNSLIFYSFLVLSFFIISNQTQSQEKGFKGSMVFSTVNGQGTSNIRPGLQLGVYQKFGMNDVPHIQIECMVTQKGSMNWNRENPRNINLYYIDVLVAYAIPIMDKLELNLGFQPSMFLGGRFKHTVDGEIINQGLRGEVPSFDYSTVIGLEYQWNNDFRFGIRYNHSFVPLQPHENIFADNRTLPTIRCIHIYTHLKWQAGLFNHLFKKGK